jgi:hypothetical protein
MTHTIIADPHLNGWQYGMLRSFENAIVEETGASISQIPEYPYLDKYIHHFGHGMRRGKFRKYLPQHSWTVDGEIGWYILMGPENYKLDLYKDWDKNLKTKILYIYDTFPFQYPLIKRLCKNKEWDILITSFNDAVDDLQKITGRQWHCIEQAADKYLFTGSAFEEKLIHFSAYGRRHPLFHEVVKDFCEKKGLYYDYTTHDVKHPVADSPELYKQYAWHLNHSLFTFSWPVEFTDPHKAAALRPITCRWFEAASAGVCIVGRKPANAVFDEHLYPGIVTEIDPLGSPAEITSQLESIWEARYELVEKARVIQQSNSARWTWGNRINRILELVDKA